MQETEELQHLGANEVVPEEFETALEVFARVLRHMFVPENDIALLIQRLRHDNYDTLLHMKPSSESYLSVDQYLPGLEFRSLRVEKGSQAVSKDMAALALRPRFAVTVLAMQRGSQMFNEPDPGMAFKADDIVVLLGKNDNLDKVQEEIFSARSNTLIAKSSPPD
jgi:CPA2 family monovalent cation:H+ antiporter-2